MAFWVWLGMHLLRQSLQEAGIPSGSALGQADGLLLALYTRHAALQARSRGSFVCDGTLLLLSVTTVACACACTNRA